jgi:hypothetical protein
MYLLAHSLAMGSTVDDPAMEKDPGGPQIHWAETAVKETIKSKKFILPLLQSGISSSWII